MERTKHLVIIGGGFAGVTLARKLERKLPDDWDIMLLSRTNLITYNPLLPEVVGASVLPGHVVAPLRRILHRTRIRMVDVARIDLERKVVMYRTPIEDEFPYDQLVFAAGLNADLDRIPGMAEHGHPLKTLGDALFLRNRVIRNLEEATLTTDPERRRQLCTFIVGGGGFSGVECAGEMHDLLHDAAPLFKKVERQEYCVHVVHSHDHLLPEVTQSLGEYAGELLRERGLQIHLGRRIAEVDDRGVQLDDGSRINGDTVVGTVGVVAHDFIAHLPLSDSRGRIPVEPSMQIEGHPGLWALGDCALVPNGPNAEPSPPTAQFAVQQAQTLARNILASIKGNKLEDFDYRAKGQLAAVGHRKAVAQLYNLKLSGLPAWLLWRAFYLIRIPTLARKVRLFLEWNWAMLFSRDVALLGFERTNGHDPDTKHELKDEQS